MSMSSATISIWRLGRTTYIVRDAGDLVGPDRLLLEGMMRVTLGKEVLEEAHILETKQGDLMMRLHYPICQLMP
jgi:hypothetical protein